MGTDNVMEERYDYAVEGKTSNLDSKPRLRCRRPHCTRGLKMGGSDCAPLIQMSVRTCSANVIAGDAYRPLQHVPLNRRADDECIISGYLAHPFRP